jgi:negative regulator of replication initiation/DNA-binding MarR family transcriptional regulator
MPKISVELNDEIYKLVEALSKQYNIPVEEVLRRMLAAGSRGIIEEQITKTLNPSTLNVFTSTQPQSSFDINKYIAEALEMKKYEFLVQLYSPTKPQNPPPNPTPNPEVEILKREIEELKNMNKSLMEQLSKKEEESKYDKIAKAVMKVVKSNKELIEKLSKPSQTGELSPEGKKYFDELTKKTQDLESRLKEFSEIQKEKARKAEMAILAKKVTNTIYAGFDKLIDELKKLYSESGKVDFEKFITLITSAQKNITQSAIDSLLRTKDLVSTLMPTPTQQGPSKVEAVKEVIGAVKDTAKEIIQEARKTAETLNKEAATATPSTGPVISLPVEEKEAPPEEAPRETVELIPSQQAEEAPPETPQGTEVTKQETPKQETK